MIALGTQLSSHDDVACPCRPALSVFGGEEEEDAPKRKLIKLQYTDEERRAMEEAQKQVRAA